MKQIIIIAFGLFLLKTACAQTDSKHWKIDSINIEKNWRTRDKIILRELEFSSGDNVNQHCLDNSMNRVWNIGNFVDVHYSIDSILQDKYLLNIYAKDAFTLVPYVVVNGNKDEKNLSMGFSDSNFLGRNISLDIKGNIGTYGKTYSAGIRLPRQLLYKNMTLSFNFSSGSSTQYRYQNNLQTSAVPYRSKSFSGHIGNPWHNDYRYSFSPNFGWNIFQHKTDSSLIETQIPLSRDYTCTYLALSTSESIGLINRYRHQRNGYLLSGGYTFALGLNAQSANYHTINLAASVYKTVNKFIELSAAISTAYTSAALPSLIHYMNSGHIKGLNNGQESGRGIYHGKLNSSFTYLYTNWLALEQSVFTHWGTANDSYFDMFKQKPRISVGSRLRAWVPTIPWLAVNLYFTYLKGNDNWMHLDI